MELNPPQRQAPKRIVLYLPASRPLENPSERVEVVVRSNQVRRLDFPGVITRYRARQQ